MSLVSPLLMHGYELDKTCDDPFEVAPSKELAIPVASDELQAMADLCDEHDDNTLLVVSRELTESGVKETFRIMDPEEAGLDQFAIHGSLDE